MAKSKAVATSIAVLTFLVFISLLQTATAQTPDTAIIQGHVFDQTHAVITDAAITATNKLTGAKREARSDSSGKFSISGLPVNGSYELLATKSGFAEARVTDLELSGGTGAQITLQLNAAAEKTQITVVGAAGQVQIDEPQIGDYLSARHIEETPLLGRKITFLPLLNAANRPAISQGDVFINQNLFTTNGTGRRQAWFEVDGSNAVDSWGRQTIFSTLPVDSLDEMTILTNSFSAEYGMTAGSVINMVTKSGGNEFHGDIQGLWRPSDTSASLSGFTTQTATGNFLTDDELGQGSFALSGPITNATHFFVAGEYSAENKGSPITSPIAPGTFPGHYRGWLGFAKIDHQINDKNTLFFRADADGFRDTNPNGAVGGNNLPTVDRIFRRRTYSAELGETAELSPTLINSLRLQFQLASPITEFDPVVFGTQFSVPISSGGTFTTGTSQSALLLNHQYEFNDTVSTVWGRHSLKFGGEVIRAHSGGNSKEFGGPIFLGSFSFNTCTFSLTVCETSYIQVINNVKSYTQSFGNGSYTVDDTLWSLFVQDDFHLRPNFTVNLGLRYERQTFTDSNKDFAPRIGFVYDTHSDGHTVFRGGFGIYYSQVVDNSQANYSLTGPTGVFNYTATPGGVGFPASIADAPLPTFPAGAILPPRTLYIRPGQASYYDQFFNTALLKGYPDGLFNPYTQQWTFGLEQQLAPGWVLSMDYVGSHTLKIVRPLDLDSPAPFVRNAPGQVRSGTEANCTRPLWVEFYNNNPGLDCLMPVVGVDPLPTYSTVTTDVNDGIAYYHALDVNLSHNFHNGLSVLASYTWSHAIDTVDPDVPGQNPNDPNFTGSQELGNAIYDQRHRFVLSGFYVAPFKVIVGGVGSFGSGLPYNIVTGANNFGAPGTTADRPALGGVVIPRNAGRGNGIYSVDPFIERAFALGTERVRLNLRAEAFNVLNHRNVVNYNGTFGNAATPPPPATGGIPFGGPLTGITAQLPARSLQFSARLEF